MRRIRTAAVVVSIAVGLLMGAGSPAQAAPVPRDDKGAVTIDYLFGMYYSLWACQYFGNSLVQGGAFSSYTCYNQYYQPDNAYYWFLYVY